MRRTPATPALQGGGCHGAFTWGVLDHLLEDGRVDIQAVSGASASASASAMNAAAFSYGNLRGGRDGARQALKDFSDAVAASAPPKFIPID